MNILLVLTLLSMAFFSSSAFAEEEPYGCPHFCSAKYGEDDLAGLADCLKTTEREKTDPGIQCGGRASPPAAARQADPEPVAPPQPVAGRCSAVQQSIERARSSCAAAGSSTGQACNSANNPAMSKITNNTKTSGSSSVQDACKDSANLMTESRDALVNFADTCRAAISSCNSACSEEIKLIQDNPSCFEGAFRKAAVDAANAVKAQKCDYDDQIKSTEQALGSYNSTKTGSQECSAQTDGSEQASTEEEKKEGEGGGGLGDLASMLGGMGGATPQEQQAAQTYCQANPTAMGCGNAGAAPNCMDPAQATTNPVCICSSNPNSPACSKEQNAGNQAAMSANQIDSSSRLAPSSMDGGGDIGNLPSIAQGPPNPGGPGDVIEGRQGSGNPVGEAGGGSGGKGFKAASGPADSDPLLRGQPSMGGGGGGRGGMMGFAGGGGSSGGPPPPRYGSKDSEGGGSQTPDLRRFLPGGTYDPKGRGLAGTSGPDGITGPHSDIWQKVQNRYNVLAPTLMP